MIINIMWGKQTMTELLKERLREAKSIRGVARETGVQHASLVRFLKGETSLRLDKADLLAVYFGIEYRRPPRRGK